MEYGIDEVDSSAIDGYSDGGNVIAETTWDLEDFFNELDSFLEALGRILNVFVNTMTDQTLVELIFFFWFEFWRL